MSIPAFEGTVQDGRIRLRDDIVLPEHTKVYVVIPEADGGPMVHIRSPRLAHPPQAADFVKQVLGGAESRASAMLNDGPGQYIGRQRFELAASIGFSIGIGLFTVYALRWGGATTKELASFGWLLFAVCWLIFFRTRHGATRGCSHK